MQQIKERVLHTFVETLPAKPYCSFDIQKEGVKIWPKTGALKANYIQANAPTSVHWLIFDIDKPNSAFLYETLNLPAPNIISINKVNGHAHYFYNIHEVYTSKNAHSAPQEYLKAIEQAYVKKLGADKGYTGLIAKNPLSEEWLSLYPSEHKYTLGELAEYVELKRSFIAPTRKVREDEGRNIELFDQLRFWAYAEKKNHTSYDSFYSACLGKAKELNAEGYNSASGYLPVSEIKATVKSITKWIWKHYQGAGHTHKNKGVMDLSETQLTPTEKMQAGALYSAEIKRTKTLKKLQRAARSAKLGINLKLNLNQIDIANRSGMSHSTVKRYWQLLLNYIFKGFIRGLSDISAGGTAALGLFIGEIVRLLLDRRPQNMSLEKVDFSGFGCVDHETERV
ncbi:replication initiation protein [Piscirickettsia litoralis]|uniref:replication initiation protein n=1 Tax=Piscirickettsia litoralis TaxID=1891921 RepID=UPI001300E6A1|nr:replication initiation protein [Piscirickettsia litoralis]